METHPTSPRYLDMELNIRPKHGKSNLNVAYWQAIQVHTIFQCRYKVEASKTSKIREFASF
jgi:hypothetical protein